MIVDEVKYKVKKTVLVTSKLIETCDASYNLQNNLNIM